MKRAAILYLLILVISVLPIVGLLKLGSTLPAPSGAPPISKAIPATIEAAPSALHSMVSGLEHNLQHPLSHLFVQLLVIVAASRLFGRLFTAIGQPSVVGEMAAGILLGPSLFGLVAPDAFAFVFSESSLGALMNTRGLMELIALNIGYDLGILSTRIFTMLVIMALVTTMLTGPLLTLFREKGSAPSPLPHPSHP